MHPRSINSDIHFIIISLSKFNVFFVFFLTLPVKRLPKHALVLLRKMHDYNQIDCGFNLERSCSTWLTCEEITAYKAAPNENHIE